jgi:hypothetical protein
MDTQLRIKGLDELRRELRRVSPQMAKQLQIGHKSISADVANQSKANIGQSGARAGKAIGQRGITPRAGQKYARIALLGSNPTIRAVEFGTRRHWLFGRVISADSMRRRVFPAYRGFQGEFDPSKGTFVMPTISRMLPEIQGTYEDRLLDAFAGAFPERL